MLHICSGNSSPGWSRSPCLPLGLDVCPALGPPPLPHFASVVFHQAPILSGGSAGMLAQPFVPEPLLALFPMRSVFHSGWLPQASAQRPHTFPIQELLEQPGDLFDVLAGQMLAHDTTLTRFGRVKHTLPPCPTKQPIPLRADPAAVAPGQQRR
jgi:hypothetical protein